MYTSETIYQGELRTLSTHVLSGNTLITDAPLDNQGKGEAFSPTDLVATALCACMLTIMGIEAGKMNADISGSNASVIKSMGIGPRRIVKLQVEVNVLHSDLSIEAQEALKIAGINCPVAKSLHQDIVQDVRFTFLRKEN